MAASKPRITAPTSGSSIGQLPVAVRIELCGKESRGLHVSLDGVDVTSFFSISGDTATATLQTGIFVGDNRLKVKVANETVEQHFLYSPAGSGTTPPPPPPPLTMVPIQTQVVATNKSGVGTNGIEVGETVYANPGPATDWQLLLLARNNLSTMVANRNYTLHPNQQNYTTLMQLIADITPGGSLIKQCGTAGCLMVLQGPPGNAGLGPYPCLIDEGPALAACVQLQIALASIGATYTATFATSEAGIPSGMGYSFIGNVGSRALTPGVNFERITCSNAKGCLNLPTEAPTENNAPFMNGIAPNGVDGVIATLAGTADSGKTSLPATPYSPAMTIYDNGQMGGNLVPDNNSNYTFAWADPPIRFQMGPAPENANKHIVILQIPESAKKRFPDGQATLEGESAELPPGQLGGFHLVVWDAVTFKNLHNSTYVINPNIGDGVGSNCNVSCKSPDGTTLYPLDQLRADLQNLTSRGNLWFLGSIGNISHDFKVYSPGPNYLHMQDVWDRVAQSVQDLGGTYATFAMLDNPALAQDDYSQYVMDRVPTDDDYNMIGQLWINDSGVPNPYAAEASRAISRQTSAVPVAGNMQGVLKRGHDGFYIPMQHSQYGGVMPQPAIDVFHASYLNPVPWPLSAPSDPAGPKNALIFIGQQIFCQATNICDDNIRDAYSNLVYTVSNLRTDVNNVNAPADCVEPNNPCSFNQQDFIKAKTQILAELNYLGPVQTLQNNLITLQLLKQPDFTDTLSAVEHNIFSSIPVTAKLHIGANTTNDVLNLVGDVSGFAGLIPEVGDGISAGVETGIGMYQLFSDDGTTVNDPNGVSLMQQEQDDTELSDLALQRRQQYQQELNSIGVAFQRIESDWGRLQAAYVPLSGDIIRFTVTGFSDYLGGYSLSLQRSLYSSLMPFNFYAVHYRYSDPGLNHQTYGFRPAWYDNILFGQACHAWQGLPSLLQNNPQSFGFWEGALVDGPGASLAFSHSGNGNVYPVDAWWDLWFIGLKEPYDDIINQYGPDGLYINSGCPPTNPTRYLPNASFFNLAELFTPISSSDSNALGFYKPWFLARGTLIHQRAVDPSTAFWNKYGNHQFSIPRIISSDFATDPDNY